jgi:ABC-2 type transport system ATP-binding protein
MLELRSAWKTYDGFDAVRGIDLQIPAGELFCFLGPNGAGKTTTIKMIAGLLRPTRGSVHVNGHDVGKEALLAKSVTGYIPDTPYLYEKLSGREYLHFIGDLYGVPRARQIEALKEYFDAFSLTSSADKLIENYSHGMRQKLCFSVAFMHRPKLLIIDEPMIGLDPRSGRTLKNLLRQYCAEGGTVFLSTHLLSVAEELAHRLGIITRGELRFLGTTTELKARMAREGNLEDLFLQLTEEEQTAEPDNPGQPNAGLREALS